MVTHEKATELQANAYALINPRRNEGEYTKYSFPSKTMEYLSTGLPVIAYMLDGMPEEYREVIICPKDNSISSLSDTIKEVLLYDSTRRKRIFNKSAEFIGTRKTPQAQVQKMIQLFTYTCDL